MPMLGYTTPPMDTGQFGTLVTMDIMVITQEREVLKLSQKEDLTLTPISFSEPMGTGQYGILVILVITTDKL